MRRTQIYLDDDQTERLDRRAAAAGVTRSTLIRDAIGEYLEHEEREPGAWRARWAEAVRATAGLATHLPDGEAYVEQTRAADVERLRGRAS